jgi:hypothetical protein
MTDEPDMKRGEPRMGKRASAIVSLFQTGERDGARERVLRATFWLSSPPPECAAPTLLDAIRVRRGQPGT